MSDNPYAYCVYCDEKRDARDMLEHMRVHLCSTAKMIHPSKLPDYWAVKLAEQARSLRSTKAEQLGPIINHVYWLSHQFTDARGAIPDEGNLAVGVGSRRPATDAAGVGPAG